MQSFSLLPPILESQLEAVAWVETNDSELVDESQPNSELKYFNSNYLLEIKFKLSEYVVWDEINHIQVNIREKATNNIAVNTAVSPDQQVLYIQKNCNKINDIEVIEYNSNTGICTVRVPYVCFANGSLSKNTEYNIQIRFGLNNLWCNTTPGGNGRYTHPGINPQSAANNGYGWNAFPAWRAQQVAEGAFGEWSNVTTLFCYDPAGLSVSAEQDQDSFTPNITFSYQLKGIDDSIEKIAVQYKYQDFYQQGMEGYTTGNLIINNSGKLENDGQQRIQFELPIARVTNVIVDLDGYSQKNIRIHESLSIAKLIWDSINGCTLKNITSTLSTEEQNDGGLWFEGTIPKNTITGNISYNIWRTNLHSFAAVKLFDIDKQQIVAADSEFKFKFADFSVEMGEDYIYSVIIKLNGTNYLLTPLDCDYYSQGYGRLMKIDSVLFTTKTHQLRLQGNVKLSGLKRNTSDAFQATIGNQYPFYSRGSLMNYRTFNIEGLITILFDKTSKFLSNDKEMGLRWIDDNKIVILNRDIYHSIEYTRNTRRINTKNPILKGTIDVDITNDERGPISKNENYVFESKTMFDDTSHTDEMIYIERKFREYVMQWLSDGKPKLFRSETEGNMIVILTGINFTPYDASGRMVYQMSCSATEIAEYNNENLRKYNLLSADLLIAEDAEEEYKISKIDPDLGMLWVDNEAKYVDIEKIFHNGSGNYQYNTMENIITDLQSQQDNNQNSITKQTVIDYIKQYNKFVESNQYIEYSSQPIVYMKILYGTDYYADLHHNNFMSLTDLIKQYREDNSIQKLQKLFAALIKNDLLDIADYPELENLAIQADYVDWVVNLQYRSLFKKFGFGVSLYQLRANLAADQERIKSLLDEYFEIENLPYQELTIDGVNLGDGATNTLPTNNGIYLLIDQYRNGNQIALWEIHSTATTPLIVSVSEE